MGLKSFSYETHDGTKVEIARVHPAMAVGCEPPKESIRVMVHTPAGYAANEGCARAYFSLADFAHLAAAVAAIDTK